MNGKMEISAGDGNLESPNLKPIALVVVGMAGSGKTTFVQRLASHLHQHGHPMYLINLDPAVKHLPYQPNIDIRDTVNYKQLMEAYQLGPNGAIVTALNLFMTKFGQVLDKLEQRFPGLLEPLSDNTKTQLHSSNATESPSDSSAPSSSSSSSAYDLQPGQPVILFDTPGQIECFTWSASSQILTTALLPLLPTSLLFIGDTQQCTHNPPSFISTLLYAVSVFYKFRVPLLLVWNKADLMPADKVRRWMTDWEAIHTDPDFLQSQTGMQQPYLQSLHLLLDEFHQCIPTAAVSSITGEGFPELTGTAIGAITESKSEPNGEAVLKEKEKQEDGGSGLSRALREYWVEVHPRLVKEDARRQQEQQRKRRANLTRFLSDLKLDANNAQASASDAAADSQEISGQ